MALEKTNISTLWYFKELHFLNEVYSYNDKMSDAVVKVSGPPLKSILLAGG